MGVRDAWCRRLGADGALTRGPSGHQAAEVERMAFSTFQRRPPSGPSQPPTGLCLPRGLTCQQEDKSLPSP